MPNNNDFVIKNGVLTEYTGEGEEKVTIPNSVKEIGASAFSDCSSLTEITIPKGVTTIGYYVLAGCNKLKNITAPAGFKDILLEKLGNQVTFIDNNEKKQKYTILNSCYIR